MKDFVAFDFETANNNRHSICSVGLVFVEDGEIKDSIHQLINPEEEFDGFNISIHHITPDDVKNEPTFDAFYNSIKEKLENKILVAHFLPFDGYALRDNLIRYEIDPLTHYLLCTYQLSKRLLSGHSSYTLKSLCQHYGVELINHHSALSDAKACAELMLRLSEQFKLEDLDSLRNIAGIRYGEISKDIFRSSLVYKNSKKFNLSDIEINEDADTNSVFFGKNVVFTGKLSLYTRKEVAQLVANKGGKPQNGINKDTDYIIVGNFDDVMIKGNKSSKLIKAEKMISEGKELEIIGEKDFFKML